MVVRKDGTCFASIKCSIWSNSEVKSRSSQHMMMMTIMIISPFGQLGLWLGLFRGERCINITKYVSA
jgi:hypothetical protein